MRFLAISIAISAVVAIPLPSEPPKQPEEQPQKPEPLAPLPEGITWDNMPVIHPGPDYIPPEPSRRDKYYGQFDEDLPWGASGWNHDRWSFFSKDLINDPAGTIFQGLQEVGDTSGDALKQFPGGAALGTGLGAVYTFLNPPGKSAAPGGASAGP